MILYILANTRKFTPYDNTYVAMLIINTSQTYIIESYKKIHTVTISQYNKCFAVAKNVHKGIFSWRIYIK